MLAIYKRELKSYFRSFIGFLFIAVTLFFLGLYFSVYNLMNGYPYFAYVVSSVTFLFMLTVPILTMRILAEEKRSKTDQLILTAPVSVGGIVMGKFLALLTIFAIPVAIICFYPLIMAQYGSVPMGEAYLSILAYFLFGMTAIAIGLFLSSLTESQVIAAVLTFVLLFAFYMMNGISSFFSETAMSTCVTFGILIIALSLMIYSMIKNAVISGAVCVIGEVALVIIYVVKSSVFEGGIQKVLEVFNLSSHFENFTNSIFDVTGVLYFLSVIAICIFLTMQTILKRRWN